MGWKHVICSALASLGLSQIAHAQNTPSVRHILHDLLHRTPEAQTPLDRTNAMERLPVEIDYGDITLSDPQTLSITAYQSTDGGTRADIKLSSATVILSQSDRPITLTLNVPKNWQETSPILILDAKIRDNMGNVLGQADRLTTYHGQTDAHIRMVSTQIRSSETNSVDIFGYKSISGEVKLPKSSEFRPGSRLHVQLIENALAGGMTMILAADTDIPLEAAAHIVPFQLERAITQENQSPDLTFKVWVSDLAGRKTHIMRSAVPFMGADADYAITLDALKQGKDTKRGRNLSPELMAQTLVQGDAEFDPVNGIPGQARLRIELRQDRGDQTVGPIISEQTYLLRGMETRIPFSLTTDSTYFDPYIPAPFLSVELTDSTGRVYYASGAVRASEARNLVRLYPR